MIIAGSGSSSENTVGGLSDPKTPEILVTNLDESGSVGDFTSPPSVSRSRGSTVHTNIHVGVFNFTFPYQLEFLKVKVSLKNYRLIF